MSTDRAPRPWCSHTVSVATYNLVGMGTSDLTAYDREKYASLHGHAGDLLELVDAYAPGKVIFVGHSVSAMIGLLATIRAPDRFTAQSSQCRARYHR